MASTPPIPPPGEGRGAPEARGPAATVPRGRGAVLWGLAWNWLPVLVWMAVIISLSGRSDMRSIAPPQVAETQGAFFAVSKAVHVFEYSVLGLLLLRAFYGAAGGLSLALGAAVVASVLVAGLFGAMDELRQSFVPNRSPRIADIALDTASALVATVLAAVAIRVRQSRATSQAAQVAQQAPR